MKTLFTRVLLITAAVMLMVAIFPPWSAGPKHLGYSVFFSPLGVRNSSYYGPTFTPGAINVTLLLAEEAILLAIGVITAFAVAGQRSNR